MRLEGFDKYYSFWVVVIYSIFDGYYCSYGMVFLEFYLQVWNIGFNDICLYDLLVCFRRLK